MERGGPKRCAEKEASQMQIHRDKNKPEVLKNEQLKISLLAARCSHWKTEAVLIPHTHTKDKVLKFLWYDQTC